MTAKSIIIKRITHHYKLDHHITTAVYVDDKYIGGGDYGGEPEDNSFDRDYEWVEPPGSSCGCYKRSQTFVL